MANSELTEAERETGVVETFASWALEGLYPTEQDRAYAWAYIKGEMTTEEIIQASLVEFRAR